jgi:hypothetical protein
MVRRTATEISVRAVGSASSSGIVTDLKVALLKTLLKGGVPNPGC